MVAISVVLAFLFFIIIDIVVLKFQGKTHPAFENPVREKMAPIFVNGFDLPEGVFLSKGHTWVKKLPHDLYQIGIDNFILQAFKKVTVNNVPEFGSELKRGDIIMEVEAGNKILKFRSPVDGIIKSIYNITQEENKILNPYLQWQVMIRPLNENEAQKNLLSGKKASAWLKEEFKKLKEFVSVRAVNVELAGVTMYDGGKPVENATLLILENNIKDFENEFLTI